jgi:hypothetical protein
MSVIYYTVSNFFLSLATIVTIKTIIFLWLLFSFPSYQIFITKKKLFHKIKFIRNIKTSYKFSSIVSIVDSNPSYLPSGSMISFFLYLSSPSPSPSPFSLCLSLSLSLSLLPYIFQCSNKYKLDSNL